MLQLYDEKILCEAKSKKEFEDEDGKKQRRRHPEFDQILG